MDKTIDPRPETSDRKQQRAIAGSLQSAVCILAMLVLFPITGYAATETSKTAVKSTSTATATTVKTAAGGVGAAVAKVVQNVQEKLASKKGSSTLSSTSKSQAKVPEAKTPATLASTGLTSKEAAAGQKKKVKKTWEEQLPGPDPAEEKLAGEEKVCQGVVSGAGFNGIAVEVQKLRADASGEMWFNYVKDLKLSGVAKLAELQMGDTVKVSYKQTKNGRRILKGITLIRKAPAAPAEKVQEEETE